MEKIDFSFRKKTKRWLTLLSFCLMLCMGQMGFAQCNYTLQLSDSWGDGWNGGKIDVLVNGIVIIDDATLGSGSSASFDILVETDDSITTVYESGSYSSENGYRIVDVNNNVVFSSNFGEASGPPVSLTIGILATCPACPAPTSLTAQVTPTSAALGWTGTGDFDIKWGASGFDVETEGTLVAGASNPYNLGGLTTGVSYQFYVRQDCDGDFSDWAGPFSFVPNNYNVIGAGASNTNGTDNDPIDDYFSSMRYQTVYTAAELTAAGFVAYNELTGLGFSVSEGTDMALLNYQIRIGHTTASNAGAHINSPDLITVRNPASYLPTVVGVDEFDMLTFNTNFVWNGVDNIVIDICTGGSNPYSAPHGGVRSHSLTNGSRFVRADTEASQCSVNTTTTNSNRPQIQFSFIEGTPPACPAPAGLSATNLTYSSADLGWISDGEQFDIKWGTPGFDVEEEGALEEDFVSGATLSGLDAETTYEFYVRQNCGEEMSDWAGPYSFYTGYCVPTGTSNSYRITGVSTSGGYTNISNLSNGTTNPYNDYTYMSVTQSQGESISYSVTVPAYSGGLRIWVDLNQDLIFDEDELVATHTTYNVTTLTGVINIPEELPLGNYRIRIRSNYSSYTIPACGDAQSGYGEAEDYTLSVVAPPTCFPPTDLTATNLTYSSADLGWTSDGDTFDILWDEAGFDVETEGTLEEGFVSGGTLPDLDAITTYQFYVRNNCGVDGLSVWAGPFGFTTLCAPEVAPTAVQSFSDFTTTAPNPACWSEATGAVTANSTLTGTTSKWAGGNFGNTGSNTSARINLYSSSSDWLISPQIDLGAIPGLFRVKYDMAVTSYSGTTAQSTLGSHIVRVIVSTDGGATWSVNNTVKTYTGVGSYSNTGQTETVNLTEYSGVVKIAFVATTASTSPDVYFYVDNFTVENLPSCLEPSNLTATNITANSADLSWTSDGDTFDIKWGMSGFDVETEGTLEEGFENGGTLSGLDSITAYQFYVRNNCGGGDLSVWAGPFAFTTPCTPATTGFSQNFDAGSAGTSSNPNLTDCWSFISTGVGYGYVYNFSTPNTAPNHFYMYNNSDNSGDYILVSPPTDNLGNGEYWVKFYAKSGGTNYSLQFGTLSDGTDSSTFTVLENITLTTTYQEYIVALPAGTDDYFAFRHGLGGTYRSVYIDNIVYEEAPSCLPPTALTANPTHNSAVLGWTSDGDTFDIKWGMSGFDVETEGTLVEDFVSGGTLPDLDAITTYQFYVRNNCGGGDISDWAGPFGFTTLCAPEVAPTAVQSFSDFTTTAPNPACWSEATGAVTANSTLTGTTSKWAGGNFGNTGSNTSARINLYGTSSDWLMSQQIDLGSTPGAFRVKYDMAVTSYSGTTAQATLGTHIVRVIVSTDGGFTWSVNNTVKTYTGSGTYSNTGQSETVDLEEYSGVVKIAFVATTSSTSPDVYFFIDNFLVEEIPSCLEPTDLTATNITSNSADLSWTSDGDTFDIKWGMSGFDVEEDGTLEEGFANGGTLSGLAFQTTYQYYVRQDCGSSLSPWTGPVSFTTSCIPFGVPYFEGFENGYTNNSSVGGCLSQVSITGDQAWTANNIETTYNRVPRTGSWNAFLRYSNEDWLFIPVQLTGDISYDLSFYARQDGSTLSNASVKASYGATNSIVGMTNVIIEQTGITNGDYQLVKGSFVPSETGVYYIGINGTINGSPWYISIDDILLKETPSCLEPSDLTAIPTHNSVVLGWESEGSTFDISWGAGAFDAEDGTIVSLANGGTLSGLTAQTTYQYYVRQNCGVGDVSMWSGPFGFTTACEAFDLPYSQDFEGVTAPSLPSCTSIETLNGNPWRTSSSAVTGMTGNKLNYPWHASETADAWFYTPGLNLEAGKNYAISYKYGNNSTFYTESMRVAYGTSAMASVMNEVLADHNAINSTGVSENEVFFTVAANGVYYFGFQSYSIANQNQLYVDDILIRELGDPCTGTPDAGIATASMSSGESGSAVDFAVTGYENDTEGLSFDWEYSVDNGVTWNSTGASDNEVTFTITGTIGTVFQVRYAATCSFSESTAYSNVVTFTVALPLEYCTPTYTDLTYDDRLSVVTTTGAVSNLNYSNSIRSQHFDETATILEATPGQEFTLNTTYVGGEQTVGIWIDWENNNTFDDLGNRIALNYSSSAGQTFTVTIPSDVNPGDYRLRVRGSYDNHTGNGDAFACNSKYYGSSVDFTIRIAAPCSSEWTGAVSTDWNTAGNWCGGEIPTAATDVVIKAGSTNYPVISGNIEVASITVEDGASVTVNGSLTTGDITVANGGSFVVENNGDLFQTTTAVNTGEVSVKQMSNPMFRLDYTLWSSPVTGQNLQAFSPETLSTRIYKYDAATDAYDNTYSETTFLTGQGYLFRSPNNWVINDGVNTAQAYQGVFAGVPNNGNVSVNVLTNAYNGLGNPYPSGIDATELFATNSGIQAIYFWTNSNAPVDGAYATTTNNWATRTTMGGTSADGSAIVPTGEIAKGQGFIAYINDNTSVAFNNDMRISDGQFFKPMQEEKHRFWLNLYTPDLMLNQILIGYMTGATQGADNQIDGEMLDYGESALYSLIDNSDKQFVIQGRSLPFEAIDVVPLGFTATTAGEFTISLANFDGLFAEGQNIYLKDNVTQAVHNLKESVYTFISDEGTFDTRFEVVYQTAMSVETPDLNDNWIVFKQNEQFQILTQGFEIKEVQVFDMLGRTVYASAAEGTTHSIARIAANQVLIVKVTTMDGEVLTKKVQN